MNLNPYVELLDYAPDRLHGRNMEIAEIADAVTGSAGPLEFHGLPHMGKSSLLQYVADSQGLFARNRALLREPFRHAPERLLPVLVEYAYLPPDVHPFGYLCLRLQRALAEYRDRFMNRPDVAALPVLQPVTETPQDPDYIRCLYAMLSRLHEQRIRTVLLLDDFDVALRRMSPDQLTLMRAWREFSAFVLTTEQQVHEVNPGAAGSPFWQKAITKRLGALPAEAARALVEEPAQRAGSPLPQADISLVLTQAGGHPFLLILAAKALWDLRSQGGILGSSDLPLSPDQRSRFLGRLHEDFRRPFWGYWEHLTNDERETLHAVALDHPMTPKQQNLLSGLSEKGLLVEAGAPHGLDEGSHEHFVNGESRFKLFSPRFSDFMSDLERTSPVATHQLTLTGYELNLYEYLRSRPGEVCSFDDLLQYVWGTKPDLAQADLDKVKGRMRTTMSRLRAKLKSTTREDIVDVRGLGYRLIAPPSQ
jgi:DNA-binding winged helix-turn-helix (wHTH) protein